MKKLFHVNGEYHYLLEEYMRDKLMQPKYKYFVRWCRKTFYKDDIEYFKNEYYLYLQEIKRMVHFPE